MRTGSRWLAGISALALALAFVLPLWSIRLKAPQYPEGLGMHIRVNNITGVRPNDLRSINGLNHYIGMAKIEPGSIAELRYMPWILGGLIALGLMAAISGKRAVLAGWAATFMIAAALGLADFYRWGYDYGHHLNPEAAIKIPGMAYQPPLIGSKKILNFTANSWPASGGWIMIAAFLTILALVAFELRARAQRQTAHVGDPPVEPSGASLRRGAPGATVGH